MDLDEQVTVIPSYTRPPASLESGAVVHTTEWGFFFSILCYITLYDT